jgi:monoamine oxidase
MPMTAQCKIAWESPRFWEKENNTHGGISFLDQDVDLVWYPSDKMFPPLEFYYSAMWRAAHCR